MENTDLLGNACHHRIVRVAFWNFANFNLVSSIAAHHELSLLRKLSPPQNEEVNVIQYSVVTSGRTMIPLQASRGWIKHERCMNRRPA